MKSKQDSQCSPICYILQYFFYYESGHSIDYLSCVNVQADLDLHCGKEQANIESQDQPANSTVCYLHVPTVASDFITSSKQTS